MALFTHFCTKHKLWTHTAECLRCALEKLLKQARPSAEVYSLSELPKAQRAAFDEAIIRGDVGRVSDLLKACPFLPTQDCLVLLHAAETARWALHSDGNLSDEAHTEWSSEPNAFRFWPDNWRESVALLLLAGVVFCAFYFFLRVFGCPPPPGMP